MAQTVASYGAVTKSSIGGRFLTVTTITLGTEYLTEGIVISPESVGLPLGLVDTAFVAGPVVTAAKGVKAFTARVTAENGELKLQVYGAGAEGKFGAELASKSAEVSGGLVTIVAIGR